MDGRGRGTAGTSVKTSRTSLKTTSTHLFNVGLSLGAMAGLSLSVTTTFGAFWLCVAGSGGHDEISRKVGERVSGFGKARKQANLYELQEHSAPHIPFFVKMDENSRFCCLRSTEESPQSGGP